MNPGFPGDFSEDPDDSKEVAAEIIKIDEPDNNRAREGNK
jgi:hypothetical protein